MLNGPACRRWEKEVACCESASNDWTKKLMPDLNEGELLFFMIQTSSTWQQSMCDPYAVRIAVWLVQ
jgi:hypothetical protein